MKGFELARKVTDNHLRAGELSAAEKLPAPLRQLMQTLRMLAYHAETGMAASLAPQLDNPVTARSLLKALFRCEASLLPNPAAGTLMVRPAAPSQLRLTYELPSNGGCQQPTSQPHPAETSAQTPDNSNRTLQRSLGMYSTCRLCVCSTIVER